MVSGEAHDDLHWNNMWVFSSVLLANRKNGTVLDHLAKAHNEHMGTQAVWKPNATLKHLNGCSATSVTGRRVGFITGWAVVERLVFCLGILVLSRDM